MYFDFLILLVFPIITSIIGLILLSVSGAHARIRKKEDNLLVMDLDSTNGTFVDEKRLRPGVVTIVSPGSFITFGTILTLFYVWNFVML